MDKDFPFLSAWALSWPPHLADLHRLAAMKVSSQCTWHLIESDSHGRESIRTTLNSPIPSVIHMLQLSFSRLRTKFIIRRRNSSTSLASALQQTKISSMALLNLIIISDWPYPIYASERLHDRKSIFLAHASRLPSDALFPLFLEVLTASSKLKKATHCMYAYRTSQSQPTTSNSMSKLITGQHDGGESGSGNHLARLLDVTGCENTVVVVSRWYGGVQLGGDRWRRITHVAKEALDKGGFCGRADEVNSAIEKPKKRNRKRK